MVQEIARARGLREWNIVAGAGSSSLIFSALPRLLPPGARVLMLDPMYGEYKHVCSVLLRAKTTVHQLTAEKQFAVEGKALSMDTDAVLLVNPNNPTGRLWPKRELLAWLDSVPESTLVWVDEAYIDYAGVGESVEAEAAERPNLVVLKSKKPEEPVTPIVHFLEEFPAWSAPFLSMPRTARALTWTSISTTLGATVFAYGATV
jgi:histidinol-phosphate/aromatic aminotransferase/cobyric acid decarboxylase-like protein